MFGGSFGLGVSDCSAADLALVGRMDGYVRERVFLGEIW
jgi:hypothetical protein